MVVLFNAIGHDEDANRPRSTRHYRDSTIVLGKKFLNNLLFFVDFVVGGTKFI